jgi:tRNA-2-methylthio-N6-dimethylallyladenosine synthase
MKTVFIKTHGCQMNEYDSNRMIDLLKTTHGLSRVQSAEEADLILMNTCSIREKAQEKVFSELGRYRELKEQRPEVVIGVGGCVASQEGEELQKRAPYVDIVFGPQTLHRLPNLLSAVTKTRNPQLDISFPEIEKFDKLPEPKADGPSAYVTIMEGCSKYCSFCVVPYTRGEEISRPFDDILHEVVSLAEQGVREITLLGQNVNAYRGKMHNGEIADLALLIQYIAEVDTVGRIRFMTSHPLEFSERLIQAYADIPKLANHLHLPVQSGSDRILSLMKRGHTAKDYKNKIQQLRAHRPDISITSDFIIGFPGETDEDFQATLVLVQELNLDQSYSFIYSPRPGTPAANMPDNVSEETKKQRLNIMQKLFNEQANQISQQMLGTEQIVLILESSKHNPSNMMGRTDNNRMVDIQFEHEPEHELEHELEHEHSSLENLTREPKKRPKVGDIGKVRITNTDRHVLKGEWSENQTPLPL